MIMSPRAALRDGRGKVTLRRALPHAPVRSQAHDGTHDIEETPQRNRPKYFERGVTLGDARHLHLHCAPLGSRSSPRSSEGLTEEVARSPRKTFKLHD